VVESPAFEGSRRSKQFLQHVVEKALAGHGEELKERSLGVELFGRDPSYDTGDDAIVRVTGTDVRKRLHHFYSRNDSAIRIELPAGSYVPVFRSFPGRDSALPAPVQPTRLGRRWWLWALVGISLPALLILAVWLRDPQRTAEQFSPRDVLPWSVLLKDRRPIQLVLADPDLTAMEALTGTQISLSDYANRRYLNNPDAYGSDMRMAFSLLRGVNVAAVDVGIALGVSRLAVAGSVPLKTHAARSLQLSAFKTDDHFIILGSPRSNPWGTLFQDQLDFDFVRDPKSSSREIVRNKRPEAGELLRYVPSARGWETGHAFAIVALVGSPNQTGKVLLLAGTNAEGTEAAGQFVTNLAEFARALEVRGIGPGVPACDFQILLQVSTIAGSSAKIEVVACHRLRGAPPP